MGAAASVPGTRLHEVSQEVCSLPTVQTVETSLMEDHYRMRFLRHEELLARERFLSTIMGYDSTAPYAKPLMKGKQFRSLACVDNVNKAFYQDQLRSWGFAQVEPPLAPGGTPTSLCMLDDATVVCASEAGPIWVYNWIEGAMISQMRDGRPEADNLDGDEVPSKVGSYEGAARRICLASEDLSLIASGDDKGIVALWDLGSPGLRAEAQIHDGTITGIAWDQDRGQLMSTSSDTVITAFDLEHQQVVDRAMPPPLGCGTGIPNTVLTLGLNGKMVLVGARDGKLRVWTRNDGRHLERQCTIACQGAAPNQIRFCSDGWRVAVSTAPADRTLLGGEPGAGGVLLFDLRKLSNGDRALRPAEGASHPALLGYAEAPSTGAGIAPGCADLALLETEQESLAVCLMGVSAKAFDISGPVSSTGNLVEAWDVDVVARQEWQTPETCTARPCAIAALNRTVVTATTRPLLDVWHWPELDEPYGHDAYENEEPLPALALRHRCAPRQEQNCLPGSSLAQTLGALELDKARGDY